MARMTGKVALVVGGAKGIGFAIARRLSQEGATVLLTGRQANDVAAAAQRIGPSAQGIAADAASPADLASVVDEAKRLHGRIDLLVLNAGLSEPATIAEETAEHFDRHFDVNVRGALFAVQAAVPAMNDGASIVLIGSIAGGMGVTPYSTYAATKAAVLRPQLGGRTRAAGHPRQRGGAGADRHRHDGRGARGDAAGADRPHSAGADGTRRRGGRGCRLSPQRRGQFRDRRRTVR